jgi:hypothetical protein
MAVVMEVEFFKEVQLRLPILAVVVVVLLVL